MSAPSTRLQRTLGTRHVFVAGVALVVAASTLVSDFTGFFNLGGRFAVALFLGFLINLSLGASAADLAVAHPRAGAIYAYARAVLRGRWREFAAVFLGLSFFGMFAFAATGETAAGAQGLRYLLGQWFDSAGSLPLTPFILALCGLALLPNLAGIRGTAWASAGLLIFMLGIRWAFGIAGFSGWGESGDWSLAHLSPGAANPGTWDTWVGAITGPDGVLVGGLALAFWSFVGIEFACSLAEETADPQRSLPAGILFGLLAILATSLVMGLGVTGTRPLEQWQALVAGPLGQGGDAPQLAAGHGMFGASGASWMAVASVCATLGTLTVAYASMSRVLFGIARSGFLLGGVSRVLSRVRPRSGAPVAALLVTATLYTLPALFESRVVDWLYSAAYAWIVLYMVLHVLAIANRFVHRRSPRAFSGAWFYPSAVFGIAGALACLHFAFEGAHWRYGGRALCLGLACLAVTALSFALTARSRRRAEADRSTSGGAGLVATRSATQSLQL